MEEAKSYHYIPKLDINKTKKKIIIYNNDLQYKNHKDIDIKRVKNYSEKNIDKDTIEYRFQDNNNSELLDLSHLNLISLPIIPNNILENLKYLFISENNLITIDNLSYLKHLKVIDLSGNKLKSIPELPEFIEEIQIKNNQIIDITSLAKLEYLVRMDCSNNLINKLPIIDSLEVLEIGNNDLQTVPKLKNLKKLSCPNNKINTISELKNIIILECDNNLLETVENYTTLAELYCNRNKISEIKNLNKLEILHCYGTNMKQIDYFYNLKELMCDEKGVKISRLYKIDESYSYIDGIRLFYLK